MCTACEHPQRDAIEDDLRRSGAQPNWKTMWDTYGVHHLALIMHQRKHMKPPAYGPEVSSGFREQPDEPLARVDELVKPSTYGPDVSRGFEDDISVQKMAEQGFRENWHQMDTTHRQRNLAWLQDQLMGLEW